MDLRGLSLAKFRRKHLPKPEAHAEGTSEPAPEHDHEKPRHRCPRMDWQRLPLANTRRETRVGLAAVGSFLILVVALVLNHNRTHPAVPLHIAGDAPPASADPAGKGKGAEADKDRPVPEPKADPAKDPSKPPDLVASKDEKGATPPIPIDPVDRANSRA